MALYYQLEYQKASTPAYQGNSWIFRQVRRFFEWIFSVTETQVNDGDSTPGSVASSVLEEGQPRTNRLSVMPASEQARIEEVE